MGFSESVKRLRSPLCVPTTDRVTSVRTDLRRSGGGDEGDAADDAVDRAHARLTGSVDPTRREEVAA
ncbi:hypothetical protein BN903_27 [Halorubrum sp. AJ67]|nr:hypothetical protein BN903_27 [Halorubrum sp. AJ67]